MSALEILALIALGTVYLAFCAYWWRGGHPLSDGRGRPIVTVVDRGLA